LYPSLPSIHSVPAPRGLQIFNRLACSLALLRVLGGCTLITPMGGADPEPTGSIAAAPAKPHALLPAALDEEDRRRALGALAIALDPQGNGAPVRWDNPVSKARGSVTPAGFAYPENDLVCRGFSAQFETSAGAQAQRGSACRDKNAQWIVSDLRPSNRD
jgi:17 kDa outer membrane surface antigen